MKKDMKEQILRRLKIAEGQLCALRRLVEEERYCIDTINQFLAVRQALSKIEDIILKNHLSTCVVDQIKSGKKKQAIEEIMSIYKVSKKK